MIINWKETITEDSNDGNNFYNGGWVKKVAAVGKSKSNGYAFKGEFVNPKDALSECDDGLYITCSVEGSRNHPEKQAAVFEIKNDEVTRVVDWVKGGDWALQIRDKVAALMDRPEPKKNPLAAYTTEQLLAELKRRGAIAEWRGAIPGT